MCSQQAEEEMRLLYHGTWDLGIFIALHIGDVS